MLSHESSKQRQRPQLTLKQTPRSTRLSRLLPCGRLEQKHSGFACSVFLKRTRALGNSNLVPQVMAPQKQGRTGRIRNRRGSFLRLASIRSH